jgi:hypothetical protein
MVGTRDLRRLGSWRLGRSFAETPKRRREASIQQTPTPAVVFKEFNLPNKCNAAVESSRKTNVRKCLLHGGKVVRHDEGREEEPPIGSGHTCQITLDFESMGIEEHAYRMISDKWDRIQQESPTLGRHTFRRIFLRPVSVQRLVD